MDSMLDRLLGPISRAEFFEKYLFQCPFGRQAIDPVLLELGSWGVLASLLQVSDANVIVGSAHNRWDGDRPRSVEDTRKILEQGLTVGVRQAHLHHPALQSLAEAFARDFRALADVHLYCTPAGHAGFGWHYDVEEVFILQTTGSKEWWLRKNTVNPWPVAENMPDDLRHTAERSPVMHCTLSAGDWLYIPAGYWHRTQAQSESLSLSIGIACPTGIDVGRFLQTVLPQRLLWRMRLPPVEDCLRGREGTLAAYRNHFKGLATDLSDVLGDERTAKAYLVNAKAVCDQMVPDSDQPT